MNTKKNTNVVVFKVDDDKPQIALFGLGKVDLTTPYLEVGSVEVVLKQFKFGLTICTSTTNEIIVYNNAITLSSGKIELHLVEQRNSFEYVSEDGTVTETYIFRIANEIELISVGDKDVAGWTSFTDISDFVHLDTMSHRNAFLSELINAFCHTSWS